MIYKTEALSVESQQFCGLLTDKQVSNRFSVICVHEVMKRLSSFDKFACQVKLSRKRTFSSFHVYREQLRHLYIDELVFRRQLSQMCDCHSYQLRPIF